jgi:hypothetical protein
MFVLRAEIVTPIFGSKIISHHIDEPPALVFSFNFTATLGFDLKFVLGNGT